MRLNPYFFSLVALIFSGCWAGLGYLLIFIGVLSLWVRYRSRRLSKENALLKQKVIDGSTALSTSLENLRQTQGQLIQAEKMASLGELTAGIAHEIQNPLNFVNNFSEVNTELLEDVNKALDGQYTGSKRYIERHRNEYGKNYFPWQTCRCHCERNAPAFPGKQRSENTSPI